MSVIRRSDRTSVDGQCRGRAHGGDYDSNGDGPVMVIMEICLS